MSKPFNPTKPVQTRDGRKARIICADMSSTNETIVAIVGDSGSETAHTYFSDGRYLRSEQDGLDLINVPEKHVRWVNCYRHGGGSTSGVHLSRGFADETAAEMNAERIACIRIEFKDGEGL